MTRLYLTPSEAALKRKAEAATPGLRAVHSMDGEFYQVIVPADTTGVTVICQRATLPDALLIAVANPAEILALLAKLTECHAEIERLRTALVFYADPGKVIDEYGDPVRVPDFYNELDFGDRARAALNDTAP